MASILALNVVDRVFEPRSGLSKDYKVCVRCFSAMHAALRRKSKYWLAVYHDNVSDLSDIYIRRVFLQCASTMQNPTKRAVLAKSGPHYHLI